MLLVRHGVLGVSSFLASVFVVVLVLFSFVASSSHSLFFSIFFVPRRIRMAVGWGIFFAYYIESYKKHECDVTSRMALVKKVSCLQS